MRWTAYGAATAVAVAMLLFVVRENVREPSLTVEVRRAGDPRRGEGVAVGDRLVVRVAALGTGELRVYRDTESLLARCPGDRACRRDGDGVAIEVELSVPGRYRAVAFFGTVPAPTGTIDGDLSAAGDRQVKMVTSLPIDVR